LPLSSSSRPTNARNHGTNLQPIPPRVSEQHIVEWIYFHLEGNSDSIQSCQVKPKDERNEVLIKLRGFQSTVEWPSIYHLWIKYLQPMLGARPAGTQGPIQEERDMIGATRADRPAPQSIKGSPIPQTGYGKGSPSTPIPFSGPPSPAYFQSPTPQFSSTKGGKYAHQAAPTMLGGKGTGGKSK